MKKSCKECITENEYWSIIESSLLQSQYSVTKQHQALFDIFEDKNEEQLVGFYYHASMLYRKAFRSDLWAATYIARHGCGDDSFHYFRCWLITRTKSTYYNALSNPDSLITEFSKYEYRDEITSEHPRVIVDEYYLKRSSEGIELSEIIEEEYDFPFEENIELAEQIGFNWKENDENSLRKICPNLFEMYWCKPLKRR